MSEWKPAERVTTVDHVPPVPTVALPTVVVPSNTVTAAPGAGAGHGHGRGQRRRRNIERGSPKRGQRVHGVAHCLGGGDAARAESTVNVLTPSVVVSKSCPLATGPAQLETPEPWSVHAAGMCDPRRYDASAAGAVIAISGAAPVSANAFASSRAVGGAAQLCEPFADTVKVPA